MAKRDEEFWRDDRQLMVTPGPGFEPAYLVRQLAGCATVLLVVLSWAGVGAVMVWQGWAFVVWPFVAVPAALWVLLLAGPMFMKMRAGALKTLDAVTATAEAYMARAGWVIDLNRDGAIGHIKPVTPAVEDVRPIIYNGRGLVETHTAGPFPSLPAGAVTLPDAAVNALGADLPAPAPDQVERVRMWHLPNGEKIRQDALTEFVDGLFTVGWDRGAWLGRGMTREQYDGCMALLDQARIVTDRKKGFAGRLNVRNAGQARRVLDLPVG